jgi:ornithine cyclodeaminase
LRVYSAAEVHACLPWPRLVQALEAVYAGDAQAPLRHAHALSPADTLLLMPAWDAQLVVTKLVTVIPGAPHTVQATVLVLDRATGAPLACLDGEAVTLRRTAAISALAARHLARPDAARLLMVGTGRLAPWMVRAHCALRPGLQQVDVWGRDAAAAGALASTLRDEGLPAQAVADLPAAAAAADIVCCATTARAPVVQGAWLRAGTHLDLVGAFRPDMREVDDLAVQRARIVVDSEAGALAEAGDLVQPLAAGRLDRAAVCGDLVQLLGGRLRPAAPGAELTLFKSVGMALQDLAAARAVCLAPGVDP